MEAGARASASSAGGSSRAATRAALASAVAPLLSTKSKLQLEATRVLTPKDFARIAKIKEKLASKGLDVASLNPGKLLALLQGGSAAGDAESLLSGLTGSTTLGKRKRRGGRNLGVESESESEDENQLGTYL